MTQTACAERFRLQYSFCATGMVLAVVALLARHPEPSEAAIRAALRDNLYRCTGYPPIVKAVQAAERA